MRVDRKCRSCDGRGAVYVEAVRCSAEPLHTCDHLTHFRRSRCVLCLGSGRADIVTLIIRKARSWRS